MQVNLNSFKLSSFETPLRLNNHREVTDQTFAAEMSKMYVDEKKEIPYRCIDNCETTNRCRDWRQSLRIGNNTTKVIPCQIGKSAHFWEINIFAKTAEFIICIENLWICTVNGEILKNVINICARFLISTDAMAS